MKDLPGRPHTAPIARSNVMSLECTCEWPQAQINPLKDFVKWQAGISMYKSYCIHGNEKSRCNVILYKLILFSIMFCTSTLHSDGNLTSWSLMHAFSQIFLTLRGAWPWQMRDQPRCHLDSDACFFPQNWDATAGCFHAFWRHRYLKGIIFPRSSTTVVSIVYLLYVNLSGNSHISWKMAPPARISPKPAKLAQNRWGPCWPGTKVGANTTRWDFLPWESWSEIGQTVAAKFL